MYMLTILLAVVSVGLSVAIVILLRAGAVAADVSPMIEWAKEFESVRAHIADEVGRLEGEMETLRFAVAEGIAHVERTENRIKSTVQRARSQLKEHGLEHDGLEVESAEISRWDGGGGEAPRLPLMPENMGPPQSSIPGVSADQLQRIRGAT